MGHRKGWKASIHRERVEKTGIKTRIPSRVSLYKWLNHMLLVLTLMFYFQETLYLLAFSMIFQIQVGLIVQLLQLLCTTKVLELLSKEWSGAQLLTKGVWPVQNQNEQHEFSSSGYGYLIHISKFKELTKWFSIMIALCQSKQMNWVHLTNEWLGRGFYAALPWPLWLYVEFTNSSMNLSIPWWMCKSEASILNIYDYIE